MIDVSMDGRASLGLSAFDFQPTPVVVLSSSAVVVLFNQAAQQLFQISLGAKPICFVDLPVQCCDGDGDDQLLQSLLSQPISKDRVGVLLCKLRVKISRPDTLPLRRAHLLVSEFEISGEVFRTLSFEDVTGSPSDLSDLPRHTRSSSPSSSDAASRESFERSNPKPGTVPKPTKANRKALKQKFSQLCDAMYHADDRSGFLLSADNTFCYPNYRGQRDVAPVEIDDLALFFSSWDVWAPDFSRPLPLEDYPAVWLNRDRKRYHNVRYGLKEDGKDLILEASGVPLFDPVTAEYLGGAVWLRTVGESAAVEAAELKASLSDFQNVCDRLPHMLWTVDAEGQADYFSQSWYDFTGFTEKQSLGLAFTDAIDPVDMDKIWTAFHEARATNKEVHAEAKYRRHDGQWIWMYVRAKPLIDGQGKVLKWYGTSTDIHNLVMERIQAERRNSQMKQMLLHSEIGLFEVNSECEMRALEGRMDWSTKLTATSLSRFKKHFSEIVEGHREFIVFENKIDSRWYKFRLVREDCDQGSDTKRWKALGCSVDVTEQKEHARLETENTRLTNSASLEMEKSRLKTAFLAHMSHEIRTPIVGILGMADILAQSNMNSEQQEWLQDLHFSATNLLTIVNDVLDLSKIEAGQLRFERCRYDLNVLGKQVWKLFVHVARTKSLELKFRPTSSKRLNMIGDPGRVRQILTNLVSNALKFTIKGFIEISIEERDPNLRVVIQDSGIGIDDETMATLFNSFVQGDISTARRFGGTGLGLTISRELAQNMGGSLYLESVPSKGTKAILTLPREMGFGPLERSSSLEQYSSGEELLSPITSPTVLSDSDDTWASRRLVLVVEDNAINQKVIINLVRDLGYQVKAVWNGQEALDFLENEAEANPSLLLMDCQMPLMDGYEATRRLRTDERYRSVKGIPVIALTASVIQGDREKCQATGMDDYMSKPVSKNLLRVILRKWIERSAS